MCETEELEGSATVSAKEGSARRSISMILPFVAHILDVRCPQCRLILIEVNFDGRL